MKIKLAMAAALTSTTVVLSAIAPVFAQNPFSGEDTYCQADLRADNPKARINVREGAGQNFRVRHYGVVGDRVMLLRERRNGPPEDIATRTDRQGYSWYRVGFPETRATGWVRSDFLVEECFN